MTDLGETIAPKSDQLNADDLIAGPRTVTITRVSKGSSEQPIDIFHDGGKPYRPSKGMRRLLVAAWGRRGEDYVGRSMTLYRDPKVKFGGIEVGGIKISHMTDLPKDELQDGEFLMALAENKATRKIHKVRPLRMQRPTDLAQEQGREVARQRQDDPPPRVLTKDELRETARLAAQQGTTTFTAFWNRPDVKTRREELEATSVYKALCETADRKGAPTEGDPFGQGEDSPEMDADGELAGDGEGGEVVEE